MRACGLEELNSLRTDFDIFPDHPAEDESLIISGIIPPLPVWGDRLVWGFHYLKAGTSRRDFVTEKVDGEFSEMLSLALRLEGRRDRYSWRELVRLSDLAANNHVSEDRYEGLALTKGSCAAQVRRFKSLSDEARSLVESGRLDLRTATRVSDLPDEVFSIARDRDEFSVSELRILLSRVREIMKRDTLPNAAAVALCRRIFSAESPRSEAEALRYPVLAEMEKSFRAIEKDISEGTRVRLEAPPGFEGDDFIVSFPFRSCAELEKNLRAVSGLVEICNELFTLL